MKIKVTIVFGCSDFTFIADSKIVSDVGLPTAVPKNFDRDQSSKLIKSKEFTKTFCPMFRAMLSAMQDCTVQINYT